MLLENPMNFKLRSAMLITGVLSTLVLATEARAIETQERDQPLSGVSSDHFLPDTASGSDIDIAVQDSKQVQTMHKEMLKLDHTLPYGIEQTPIPERLAPLTESVKLAQVTQREVEQTSKSPIQITDLPKFETSADLLIEKESTERETIAQTLPSEEEVFPTPEEAVPDEDEVELGQRTRSGPSYIGIGGNFGTVGDTSVGDSGIIIYSKIGLTRFFSLRPAVTTSFDEDATFLLPATLDIAPIRINNDIRLAPYFGGGAAVSTEGDFGPLAVGGIDLPVTSNLTATAGVNVGILDPVDVGVFVGIGYNFSGF